MDICFHANVYEHRTRKVAECVELVFKSLGGRLGGEYGGTIEHLWVDLELIETYSRPDGKPRFPFRFQRRVSGRSHFNLPPGPDYFNVGHFSVRPNFDVLTTLLPDRVIPYVLSLIYNTSSVLLEKQKKLGGFNASLFRERFLNECNSMGYDLPLTEAVIEEWMTEAWIENA
jgi:hypothetical protein